MVIMSVDEVVFPTRFGAVEDSSTGRARRGKNTISGCRAYMDLSITVSHDTEQGKSGRYNEVTAMVR